VARYGHEFVIDAALDQFVSHALGSGTSGPST
jgi:hypothetical protein